MSEEMIIAILVICVFLIGAFFVHSVKSANTDVRKDLLNLSKRLAPEVEWEKITKDSLTGYFQKYRISIDLVPFKFVYHSYHITLHGNFKRQPFFMLSYPKLDENIEQRGNTLFASLATFNITVEKSIYKQVHEILKSMVSLAGQLEKNA